MTRVYLGLGSNLGDRWSELSDAVEALRDLDPDLETSPVYETEPVGGPAGQGRFLNIVVRLDTDRSPHELLALAGSLEQAAGRVRAERFGPRTLDVDVLLIEGYHSDDPQLTVPHPRMWDRAFVLAPLHDLAPELVPDEVLADVEAGDGGAAVRRVGALLRRRPGQPAGNELTGNELTGNELTGNELTASDGPANEHLASAPSLADCAAGA